MCSVMANDVWLSGEQRWNDLLDCNALHHALPRIHFHSRRRMEDDQT